MIVILAAGKSTRLQGNNKLLVKAAGIPVHEWHRKAVAGDATYAVVHENDAEQVRAAAPWLSAVITHNEADGPAGALLSVSDTLPHEPMTVLFADTLLPKLPNAEGDWVGVAVAPWRIWDYYEHSEGGWTRGVPHVLVCCGIYRFTNRELLHDICYELKSDATSEVHMAQVLRIYDSTQPLREIIVEGWQDAGDSEALNKVAIPKDASWQQY